MATVTFASNTTQEPEIQWLSSHLMANTYTDKPIQQYRGTSRLQGIREAIQMTANVMDTT